MGVNEEDLVDWC